MTRLGRPTKTLRQSSASGQLRILCVAVNLSGVIKSTGAFKNMIQPEMGVFFWSYRHEFKRIIFFSMPSLSPLVATDFAPWQLDSLSACSFLFFSRKREKKKRFANDSEMRKEKSSKRRGNKMTPIHSEKKKEWETHALKWNLEILCPLKKVDKCQEIFWRGHKTLTGCAQKRRCRSRQTAQREKGDRFTKWEKDWCLLDDSAQSSSLLHFLLW